MIHTILVEADPMVAQINRQYLLQLGDFKVDHIFSNGRDALDYLRQTPVDLVVLDLYVPGISGSELLRRIRARNISCSVIVATAAAEMHLVEEALRLGVTDYLIKPYSFARFQEAVQTYLLRDKLLKSSPRADQSVIDQMLGLRPIPDLEQSSLRKGLSQKTLSLIYSQLHQHPDAEHTCGSISEASGLSQVTARRYLNYLVTTGQIVSSIDYETGGRPRILYRIK